MKISLAVFGLSYRKTFIILGVTILSSCASLPPSKLHSLTNETIQSSQGSFEKAWLAWLKPQFTSTDPLGTYTGVIATDNLQENSANENLIWQDFKRFCDRQGLIFSAGGVKGRQDSHQYRCATKTGEIIGIIQVQQRYNGLAVYVDTPEIQKQKEEESQRVLAEKIKASNEAYKQREYHALTSDTLSIDDLKVRIQRFENNDPESLVPLAKKKLAQLLVAQKNEAEAKRHHLEDKHVGDQVCAWSIFKVDKSNPYIGRWIVDEKVKIVAFVEQITGKRIQIRISGISYGNDSTPLDFLSNFNGGSTLKVGSIIWDSLYKWDECNIID